MTMPLAVPAAAHPTPATLTCEPRGGWQEAAVLRYRAPRRLLSDPPIATLKLALPQSEIELFVYLPEPRWLYSALNRFQHLSQLSAGWDSYGGSPPTYESIYGALAIMARVLRDESVPPAIVPTSEGGIQLEWHRAGDELEVRVSPKGEISGFRVNEAAGQAAEVEGVTLSDLTRLVAVTGQL